MVQIKSFFASKINWAAIILMLVSLQDYINKYDFSAITTKSWITFGLGAIILICRTWFTSQPITKFAQRQQLLHLK